MERTRYKAARYFTFILFLSVVFSGCDKEGRVRWVYYDETNCADHWAFTNNNEQLKMNCTSYLESRGVKVYEIEIFRYTVAEPCTECQCKTGRQYKCKIPKKDLRSAKNEGFYE
jgi:hypothetical protein